MRPGSGLTPTDIILIMIITIITTAMNAIIAFIDSIIFIINTNLFQFSILVVILSIANCGYIIIAVSVSMIACAW